jgi:hypothetical protein
MAPVPRGTLIVEPAAAAREEEIAAAAVTGQIVVVRAMISVTMPTSVADRAGQFVTVAAQLVTV